MFKLYFTIVLCLCQFVHGCYWNSKCSYNHFGSKTPYDDVRDDIRNVPPLDNCDPLNVWFMMRHGTRHPGSDDVINMKAVAELKEQILKYNSEGQNQMCAQDMNNLKNWQWNETIDSTASFLTEEGAQELHNIGLRFHQKWSDLLNNLDEYHFRPSAEQRTTLSAQSFVRGLSQDRIFEVSDSRPRDDVLRPYKHCDKRTNEVLNGPRITQELENYYQTVEFKHMLSNIQARIGQQLTPKSASGLYDLCRFYRAYTETRRDPWCAVFSDQDLETMEYVEDVRHYYRNGYGSSYHAKLGAMALKDLFEKFEVAANNRSKGMTGYFTHDTMMEMVYTALGLYNDYPVIAGFDRVKERKWRSSLIAPFAANLVAVLHSCKTDDEEALKVQFFVNESEIHLCAERVCTWDEFLDKFQGFANSTLDFCYS